MSSTKFGFIGAGNMGGALAQAVSKTVKGEQVIIADQSYEKAAKLAEKLGCKSADNIEVVKTAKYIFLGVKPQVMEDLLNSISSILAHRDDRFILVTMAAGLKISYFNEILGGEYPIIRIMPNTPVSVGEGMILYSASNSATEDEINEFCNALKMAGRLDKIPEELIDAGSVVSGCGPAFVYLFANALAQAGENCGLSKDKALDYAAQTLIGAGKMLQNSNTSPEQLIKNVCSPGGTTIEGVNYFNNSDFNKIVNNALGASYKRTKELAK